MTEKTMVAKFPGKCKSCGGRIEAGSSIVWSKASGARHFGGCPEVKAAPEAPKVNIDLTGLVQFLAGAKARGLKFPKAQFIAPTEGEVIVLSVAGARASVPGAVQVKIDGPERRDYYGNPGAQWVGRVNPDGEVVGKLAGDSALVSALREIAEKPAESATAYGALTGSCSFCRKALTDAGSVAVGYGPVCAKRFGLPHKPAGTKATVEYTLSAEEIIAASKAQKETDEDIETAILHAELEANGIEVDEKIEGDIERPHDAHVVDYINVTRAAFAAVHAKATNGTFGDPAEVVELLIGGIHADALKIQSNLTV